jgi:hypothetical protein
VAQGFTRGAGSGVEQRQQLPAVSPQALPEFRRDAASGFDEQAATLGGDPPAGGRDVGE